MAKFEEEKVINALHTEKAEESYVKYRDKKCEITRNANNHLHKDWRKSGVDRHKAYTDGYLDGLAEGRKEKCLAQNKDGTIRPCEVMKENEKLKKINESNNLALKESEEIIAELKKELKKREEQIQTDIEWIDNLEKENEQLKKDKEYLDNTNNEQTKVILKLQEQIEQLSNDNHVLKTSFITQQEQIEKMKDCKAEILQRIDEACIGALNAEVRAIFKKWESAE